MTNGILICDDAMFMRRTLKKILDEYGFTVSGEAENGLAAVEQFNNLKPELVIMDITMPLLDGLNALKRIREKDPGARVIMCSALGQQSFVLEAIQAGALDFIVKPFDPNRVYEAVNKALNMAH